MTFEQRVQGYAFGDAQVLLDRAATAGRLTSEPVPGSAWSGGLEVGTPHDMWSWFDAREKGKEEPPCSTSSK